MTKMISVVVTTYNRAELLKGCLESLCQQDLDRSQYEVIVVDNGSTDITHQVVQAFKYTGIIRYYFESQPGMNHARNLGLQSARGYYVAYIDDDALAAPNWLEVAINLFAAEVPTPDCLGGPIFPFYTSSKPIWFEDKYEIRRDWRAPRYLKTGESFSGSNMIWQKKVLDSLNGFDPNVGVIGNTLRLGGETIVFSKLWSMRENVKLYFSRDLIVRHWVPDFKMTIGYRIKRNLAMGQYLANAYKTEQRREKAVRVWTIMGVIMKKTVRAILRAWKYRHWQSWMVEEWAPMMMLSGEILGLAGIRLKLFQKSR